MEETSYSIFPESLMGTPRVCVMGMGFVGLAMATVAASTYEKETPVYRVMGLELPAQQPRLEKISRGELPFESEDKTFAPTLKAVVLEHKSLRVTTHTDILAASDIIVMDINLDVQKKYPLETSEIKDKPFLEAIETLGQLMSPEALLLIETTVPPGFCEHVVNPLLTKAFKKRGITTKPLIAHSYERVMPGKNYLASIREYFRTFSGLTPQSTRKARQFLMQIIQMEAPPLYEAPSTTASELAKIMENAYRSVNIAFIYEWCLMAEKMGVNLFEVIKSIRVRQTHKNIMNPGFGVGGYCLTKDALLAQWSAKHLYQHDYGLPFSLKAIETNDKMPLHVARLIQDTLPAETLSQSRLLILGVSYREDVGDTRFSPTEVLIKALQSQVKAISVHDPYLKEWPEQPETPFIQDLQDVSTFDIVVLATRHRHYLAIEPEQWQQHAENQQLWIDANNILSDPSILSIASTGAQIKGVGKGHITSLLKEPMP